eukprot:2960565-Amphidinium_carterae.1
MTHCEGLAKGEHLVPIVNVNSIKAWFQHGSRPTISHEPLLAAIPHPRHAFANLLCCSVYFAILGLGRLVQALNCFVLSAALLRIYCSSAVSSGVLKRCLELLQ